ncbi:MAG TPA: SDR family oxidoreductase [Nevskia sp.]|nr:SDR family oxidoreductase [Nevskia sp.]
MPNKILIVGATSAIAEAAARRFAQRGDHLFLAGRNAQRLEAIAADLRVRGAGQVAVAALDCNDFARHEPLLDQAEQALGGLDIALIAHGTLPDQQKVQDSVELSQQELRTNGLSVIALCTLLAPRFERRRTGAIAVISSVAGDRGRATNYVYGAAKAMVSTYLSGLRQRLLRSGVLVLTVKPGFVDTPMTRDFAKGPLWASADAVAAGIVRALDRRGMVVYLPGFWRLIMWVIRSLPERVFVRMRF